NEKLPITNYQLPITNYQLPITNLHPDRNSLPINICPTSSNLVQPRPARGVPRRLARKSGGLLVLWSHSPPHQNPKSPRPSAIRSLAIGYADHFRGGEAIQNPKSKIQNRHAEPISLSEANRC